MFSGSMRRNGLVEAGYKAHSDDGAAIFVHIPFASSSRENLHGSGDSCISLTWAMTSELPNFTGRGN